MPRHHDQRDLSEAAQQYLLALRVLVGSNDEDRVTAALVARHLGVTTQAASEMFRRLVADGLVAHAGGRDLHLTQAGRTAADGIFRRHALLEWLLTSVIGLGWAESDDEAMRLQGAISPRVEARLDEMLGHPETCPHGNPIDAETARRRPAGTALSEMEAGTAATIYRITEEAEEDAGSAVVPRGPRPDTRRPRHDPRPQRVARLADARRPARPGDARPAARRARPGPSRRSRPGPLPPGPEPVPAMSAAAARPDRAEPDRPAPHRHRQDGAVQLPLCPPHRGHVRPASRGHGPGARLAGLREGHPRWAALARPALGRRPRGRRGGRSRAVRAVPPDAPAAVLRGRHGAAAGHGPRLPVLLHGR